MHTEVTVADAKIGSFLHITAAVAVHRMLQKEGAALRRD
jgi:hypothetical protein